MKPQHLTPLSAHTVRRQIDRLASRWRRGCGRYGVKPTLLPDPSRPGGLLCMVSEEFRIGVPGAGVNAFEVGETRLFEIHREWPWYKAMGSRRHLHQTDHGAVVSMAVQAKLAEVAKQRAETNAEALEYATPMWKKRVQVAMGDGPRARRKGRM